MPFIPHTPDEKESMLHSIGMANSDSLFEEVPAELRYQHLNIPSGMNEMAMLKEALALANQNQNGICFMGAGSYEHHIPAAVWDIASRGEFLTSYTPYQAEASQGTLQLLYEYQTLIAELTQMEVANASMYDGATALAEAMLMAVRMSPMNKSKKIMVPDTLHPLYQETLKTIAFNQQIELVHIPFNKKTGVIELKTLETYQHEDMTALIIVQPNFFGALEHVDELTDWAKQKNMVTIGLVNPVSLGLLKPPGLWGEHGVDIAVGEGQPFGAPMASGGPYFGFFSTKLEFVRQMPGRLVGKTIDKEGKTGFTLTLQAREQHIRRGKATSNICTNQGLLVTAATIHMCLLGPQGLYHTALACHQNTKKLVGLLTEIKGVNQLFNTPYFHEVVLQMEGNVSVILDKLQQKGIAGGVALEPFYPDLKNTLLICATEMRTDKEILLYRDELAHIMMEF